MSGTAVVYLLVALIPLCGILYVLMPRLMPRGECFTVPILEDRADDPRLLALRRRYTLAASVLAIVETAIAFAIATAFLDGGMEEGTFLAAYVVLFLLMFPVAFCLMLRARRKVKEIKAQEGWQEAWRVEAQQAEVRRAETEQAGTLQAEAERAEARQAGTGQAGTLRAGTLQAGTRQAGTRQAGTLQVEAEQAGTRQSGELIAEGPAPRPLSLAWNLLYVPVLLFCAALVLYLYPAMPDRIPLQANLSGEVTRFVDKSPVSALLPVWIDLFFAVCFTISHWSLNRQKPPVDLTKPTTSAYAFGAYRRATCLMLLVSGILLCLSVGVALPLSSAGILTVLQGGAVVLMAAVVIVMGCIILALVYGQNGSRLLGNAQACAGLSRDDDKHWKAGVFYANADDPALFVPKRFGVGTTINFGSKPAVALVVGLVAVAVLFAVLVSGM